MLVRSLLVVLGCLSLACAATPVQAAQVQLAWDAPVQDDGTPVRTVVGYKLYYGSRSGHYQTVVAVGLATTHTVTDLANGQTYYFAITASDRTGTESVFSNEVRVSLPTNARATTTTSPRPGRSVTPAPAPSATSPSTTPASQPPPPRAPTTVAAAPSSSPATPPRPSSTPPASAQVASHTSSASAPTMTASQNTPWEMTLTSTSTYANPFLDVTVTVAYTKAGASPLHGYGFWDGGPTFKLRQAFPAPGTWHYQTTATDPANRGLHHQEGDVQVLPYTGTNPLYRHGFLQVSADHRFFVHADGTPFLWLGDLVWGAMVSLTEAGFHAAVADRRAKQFTVLQTNFAREDDVDTAGDTLWQGDRWNVRFMQKLDRMFRDANDQGMYLFVNGVGELLWDRGLPASARLLEMIGARYGAHYVSFAASMYDFYAPLHAQLTVALHRTAPRTLVAQPPGAVLYGLADLGAAPQSADTPWADYVLDTTGGSLDMACQHAIDWALRLYTQMPPTPMVNGQAWYAGVADSTADMIAQLGYLSFLSGSSGYTYGSSLWNVQDADLPAWKALRGATYMQYLYAFFAALDGGRPLQPRHDLITHHAPGAQACLVAGVSADGRTYAAFLPQGGTISLDLTALAQTTVGITWYNPLTGHYHEQGTTPGGAVHTFVSPFGANQSALVLTAQDP